MVQYGMVKNGVIVPDGSPPPEGTRFRLVAEDDDLDNMPTPPASETREEDPDRFPEADEASELGLELARCFTAGNDKSIGCFSRSSATSVREVLVLGAGVLGAIAGTFTGVQIILIYQIFRFGIMTQENESWTTPFIWLSAIVGFILGWRLQSRHRPDDPPRPQS